jgi:hypothetical protein
MCEADPFAGLRGSMCFPREDGRKNLGRGPVHQRKDGRDAEEKCKAAANTLRKIQKVPPGRMTPNRLSPHAVRPSNASFETKHRLPVAFRGSPSWVESVVHETLFCENKIALRFSTGSAVR